MRMHSRVCTHILGLYIRTLQLCARILIGRKALVDIFHYKTAVRSLQTFIECVSSP